MNEANTVETDIRSKYNYILEAINEEHTRKVDEIQGDPHNGGQYGDKAIKHTAQRMQTEQDRHSTALKEFESKIEQLTKHADKEVCYTPIFGSVNTELDTLVSQGYQCISKIDVTSPKVKMPKTYIYKLIKKENETVSI